MSDHCWFSPWNMSFLFVKTLVLHKFTPSILATSILPIIFSTSGWISSRNPTHRRVYMSRWNFGSRIRITSMRYFQDASCRSSFLTTVIVCSSFICILYVHNVYLHFQLQHISIDSANLTSGPFPDPPSGSTNFHQPTLGPQAGRSTKRLASLVNIIDAVTNKIITKKVLLRPNLHGSKHHFQRGKWFSLCKIEQTRNSQLVACP